MLVATHSRYVVDLNRDPSGEALYPGADNTELCPTRTFANEPIYREGEIPGEREIAARRGVYHDPYHATLAAEIARVRARHGHAILLDAHERAKGLVARPRHGTGSQDGAHGRTSEKQAPRPSRARRSTARW